jgi:phage gp36-like protein
VLPARQPINHNENLTMFRTAYEDAIAWLEKIMKAQIDPAGWIYKTDDDDTNRVEGQGFFSTSNSPRTNHY